MCPATDQFLCLAFPVPSKSFAASTVAEDLGVRKLKGQTRQSWAKRYLCPVSNWPKNTGKECT